MLDIIVSIKDILFILCYNLNKNDLLSLRYLLKINTNEFNEIIMNNKKKNKKLKIAFDMFNKNRVVSDFKILYPEFPEKFIYSLPFLRLKINVSDYIDSVNPKYLNPKLNNEYLYLEGNAPEMISTGIASSRESDDIVVVCGRDVHDRSFVATKTKTWTSFIHARYNNSLLDNPRTGGDRSIFSLGGAVIFLKPPESEGKTYIREFILNVIDQESSK
tara:strand:- start:90 stop:740 length:651 start_codon:yes stop_codon:yes gene_type:complete